MLYNRPNRPRMPDPLRLIRQVERPTVTFLGGKIASPYEQ
jgi:hypothetical protein